MAEPTGVRQPLPTLSVTIPKVSRPVSPPPSTTPGSTSSTTFHKFRHLPPELRLKVYSLTLSPRTVEIFTPKCLDRNYSGPPTYGLPLASTKDSPSSTTDSSDENGCRPELRRLEFVSQCKPPALLAVCAESRDFALKHYQLAFGARHAEPKVYFSFELDTLYFPEYCFGDWTITNIDCFEAAVSQAERGRVRTMGISTLRWRSIVSPGEYEGEDDDENDDDYDDDDNDNDDDYDNDDGSESWRFNGQFDIRSWPGLQELVWVCMLPFPNGLCSSCEDVVRPRRPGLVEFGPYRDEAGRERDEGLDGKQLGVRRTRRFFEARRARMRMALEGWEVPTVRVLMLFRDGKMAAPEVAGVDMEVENLGKREEEEEEEEEEENKTEKAEKNSNRKKQKRGEEGEEEEEEEEEVGLDLTREGEI